MFVSQLIRFARASRHVADFNTRNKLLTQKLLKQDYRYNKFRKTFSKFYRRYYDLISKFQIGLKSLLGQGLSLKYVYKPFSYGRDFPTKLLVSILVFVFLRLQFYFVNYVIVSCELPYYNSFGQQMLLKK